MTLERLVLRCDGCGTRSKESASRAVLRSHTWGWSVVGDVAHCPKCKGERPRAACVLATVGAS